MHYYFSHYMEPPNVEHGSPRNLIAPFACLCVALQVFNRVATETDPIVTIFWLLQFSILATIFYDCFERESFVYLRFRGPHFSRSFGLRSGVHSNGTRWSIQYLSGGPLLEHILFSTILCLCMIVGSLRMLVYPLALIAHQRIWFTTQKSFYWI